MGFNSFLYFSRSRSRSAIKAARLSSINLSSVAIASGPKSFWPSFLAARLVIKGKGIGKCVHGGPYKGYIEVPE
jgi:hypothetical protein